MVPNQTVLRSRIILGCADGQTSTAVTKELGITNWTVGKWRARFLKERLPGLQDELRLGPPRTISDEQVMEVVNKTLSFHQAQGGNPLEHSLRR